MVGWQYNLWPKSSATESTIFPKRQCASDAADFFFPSGVNWTSLTEIRLFDANGKSAGNIDVVLVSYDDQGQVLDFGALEVQAVYISGNVRDPFTAYIQNPEANGNLNWIGKRNYPRADFLSSSRKRLAPQLIYKGDSPFVGPKDGGRSRSPFLLAIAGVASSRASSG